MGKLPIIEDMMHETKNVICLCIVFFTILMSGNAMSQTVFDFGMDRESTLTGKFNENAKKELTDFYKSLHGDDGYPAHTLPDESYVDLLKITNGGVPNYCVFQLHSGNTHSIDRFFHETPKTPDLDQNAEEYATIDCVWGMDRTLFKPYYVPFAKLSLGDYLCFDYRKEGRPQIVVIDARRSQRGDPLWRVVKTGSKEESEPWDPKPGVPVVDFVARHLDEFVQMVANSKEKLFVPDFQLTQNADLQVTPYDDSVIVEFEGHLNEYSDIMHIHFERQYKEVLRKCNGGKPKLARFELPGGSSHTIEYMFHLMYAPTDYRAVGQEANDTLHVRGRNESRLGKYLVPIARLTSDDLLCFDYTAPGRAKIVLWDHQTSQDEHPVTTFVADNLDELCKMLKPDP